MKRLLSFTKNRLVNRPNAPRDPVLRAFLAEVGITWPDPETEQEDGQEEDSEEEAEESEEETDEDITDDETVERPMQITADDDSALRAKTSMKDHEDSAKGAMG